MNFISEENTYTKEIKKHPKSMNSYLSRAEFYERINELNKAEQDYFKAIEIESSPYEYWERAIFFENCLS